MRDKPCRHDELIINFPKWPPRWLPMWLRQIVLSGPILTWWSSQVYFTCRQCGEKSAAMRVRGEAK